MHFGAAFLRPADNLERRYRFPQAKLHLVQLAVASDGEPQPLRTAASAGALYPLEIHVYARRVRDLQSGVYHHDALEHRLRRQSDACDLTVLTPTGDVLPSAAAVVFISGVFWRARFKYGLRGYRFTLFEAGHVAQNLLLAGTAMGLATVVVGGFFDARVDSMLGFDAVNESSLLAVAVGHLGDR